jgi:glyoxylase I family protein
MDAYARAIRPADSLGTKEEKPMPVFGAPSHIDLSVSDTEASATWHSEVLNLKRLRRVDLENRIMIVLVHEATGLTIGLNQHTVVPVARFDDRNAGLDHIGFSVTERAVLDVWEEQFAGLNVVHSPVQDTANGAALVFRDPDNIQLEFWWSSRRRATIPGAGAHRARSFIAKRRAGSRVQLRLRG